MVNGKQTGDDGGTTLNRDREDLGRVRGWGRCRTPERPADENPIAGENLSLPRDLGGPRTTAGVPTMIGPGMELDPGTEPNSAPATEGT